MQAPKLEKQIGIEVYATSSAGIGGSIRENVEDFVVEEVLVDGSKAQTKASKSCVNSQVLGCSTAKNRYLLCVMVKRNWDTLVAVENIANQLGIGSRQIQIAGIKDAKALTAQYITIEGGSPEQAQKIHVKDIEIRPLGYLNNRLSAYYLLGNSFHIRIKTVNHPKKVINERVTKTVEELKAIGGIPNFFGHQRFGTTRPITHLVGKAIIKKDPEKAAMLFLAKPSPHEHPSSRRARKQLRATRDFEEALEDFPKQLRYERSMLRHLVKHPEDFAGAFRTLPFKLQEMFIQAYESYLFNKFLSRRIAQGLPLNMAEVGDYVVAIERSGLPVLTIHKTVNLERRTEINNLMQTGKLRLAIPLIGFKQYPSLGVQGEIEKRILEEEDVSPRDFRISAMPEISTKGRLRAAITPINNLLTDEISLDANRPCRHEVEATFMLYRGSYATILLREIMKPRSIIKEGF
ncbi:MAG: tRNA pseudouridine(13) synthase TruD [Candidatus Bathyarchaeia archaeon]